MQYSQVVKKPTATSYAILGLLALRPWSGYELSQQMRRSVGEFWPRAERGIYTEAKNLVAHGFAAATPDRTGRRRRTVYSITVTGRRALKTWLADTSPPPQFESEAVLRIAFAEHGTKSAALDTLSELRSNVAARRQTVTDVAREYLEGRGRYPERVHVIAVVSRFFGDYFALLEEWATWAIGEIETWDDVASPSAASGTAEALSYVAALRPATDMTGVKL